MMRGGIVYFMHRKRLTHTCIRLGSSVSAMGDSKPQTNNIWGGEHLVRKSLVQYSAASNLMHNEKIRELMSGGHEIYHFGFGQSPFPLMRHAADRLKKHSSESAYLPVAGIPALREAICEFHGRHDGITLQPENALVGPGSKELIFLLMNVFEGDILVISPSWTSYKPQVQLSQHTPRIITTQMKDEWKITAQSLQQFLEEGTFSPVKLLIFNNPDNPTGTFYTKQELQALSDVCRKNKVIVLADEIYARLTYNDEFVSMAKVYPEGTVLCSGMSKWASMGGWRVGYHVYPAALSALRDAVRSAASHTFTSVAAPIQHATVEILRDHETSISYMKHTTRIMAAVAKYCHTELTAVGVEAVLPKGGYYIFPNFEILRDRLSTLGVRRCEDMVNLLFDETSVSVMAGGPGFLRPEDEFTVRLCFVNFHGREALQASEDVGLNASLSENFVHKHCTPVHDGIQAIVKWVKEMQGQ